MLFLILAVPVLADAGSAAAPAMKDAGLRNAPGEAAMRPLRFKTRKRYTYLMAWNGIPVGSITAESRAEGKYNGKDVYEVTVRTESNKFLSAVYRIEDVYTSYIDTRTMTSLHYEADRKEGSYRKHVIVEYDVSARKAVYRNLTDGSVKSCDITEDVEDPVSAICYFMTKPASPDEKIRITVNLNEKNYDLYAHVERRDMIHLGSLGRFEALRVRPYVFLEGKSFKKGSGYMYFSADEGRYPLYGTVWIPFGKVTATLRTIEDL